MLYIIIADDTFDQVCETEASAKKEKRDLEKIGCTVRIRKARDWAEANAIEDCMNNR